QVLLGGKTYKSHEMLFAGSLITCGHCGHPITGETKAKQTKAGVKEYVYYRCTQYNKKDHPRVRLSEDDVEKQVTALFDRIQFNETTRDWFGRVLRARAKDTQKQGQEKRDSLAADLRRVQQQKDRLVNMRLNDEIDSDAFARKQAELRERIGEIQLQLEAADREQSEIGELAIKAFELSQSLPQRWVIADIAVKRQILEIVCLNWTLDGVSLVPTIRKPFSVLAEGLVSADNRNDWI
ncbi:MAG: zinc ribbon domain-containing protein, partial [Bacillota bacterium]